MEKLVLLVLFLKALRYIYGSIYNIVNLINITFDTHQINFYFNYLVLVAGIIFLISIIGSIKRKKIFINLGLIFIFLELIYIIYTIIFSVIGKVFIGVIIILCIYLLIDFYLIKYIKANWLNK